MPLSQGQVVQDELLLLLLLLLLYHCLLYAGQPYTYSRDKPCPQGIHCCSYSVFVVYGASMSRSCVGFLFFYVSTFRSMCAVPNMAVFCISLASWFPGMSHTYFLNDLEMVPVAPIITGITLVYYYYYHHHHHHHHHHHYTIWMSLVTGLFFLVLLLNQR